jgi:hypothetical protein
MPMFTVETLTADQYRSAFPLIREAIPGLDLAAWLRFASQLNVARKAGQSGIVAARREGRAYPCGLFCYRVDQDLERGRLLIAEHFVAVDLLDPAGVVAALLAELEALGRRLDCSAVRSVVHGVAPEVTGSLSKAGHTPDGTLLLKPLLAAKRTAPDNVAGASSPSA